MEKKKVSTDDFLNKWNGVVIAIEQGVKLERKRLSLFKSKYVLLVLILFSLFVIKMEQMNGLISIFNFGIILIGVLINSTIFSHSKIDSLIPTRGFCITAPKSQRVDDFTKFIQEWDSCKIHDAFLPFSYFSKSL